MSAFTGRYVFIAGLHRTGTSLLARMIGEHPDIAQITDAPVPENEGCYLQGAIPHTARHGIPGHYATDPPQHLIEECRFDTLATRQRMEADWARWFDPNGSWRVEKSPVNLTRMRLYQQLFPQSQFVVIFRHPEAMAAAMAKWTGQGADELIDYGLDAYELALADAEFLHSVYVLRYEDLVREPATLVAGIHLWLGLDPASRNVELRDGNRDYPDAPVMSPPQEERAATLGYTSQLGVLPFEPRVTHPLRAQRRYAEKPLRLVN